ncbi:MAG: hypothetical protein ACF8PN_06335 [Phycisphaerales bacterium]
MAIETRLATSYWIRKAIFAVALLVVGVWSTYDGWVKYPAEVERFAEYRRFLDLEQERLNMNLTPDEARELEALEQSLGVSEPDFEKRKPKERSELDVLVQRVVAGLCFLFAAVVIVTWVISARKKYLYKDDGTLEAPEGTFPPTRQTGLDKTRWMSKSIAMLEIDGGPRVESGQAVKLDAWIYAGMEEIIADLDRRFHPESEAEASDADAAPNAAPAPNEEDRSSS